MIRIELYDAADGMELLEQSVKGLAKALKVSVVES